MKEIVAETNEERMVLVLCMSSPRGNDSARIRRIEKIAIIIEASRGVVKLDDDDFDFVLKSFQAYNKWGGEVRSVRKAVISIEDRLDEAKKAV